MQLQRILEHMKPSDLEGLSMDQLVDIVYGWYQEAYPTEVRVAAREKMAGRLFYRKQVSNDNSHEDI